MNILHAASALQEFRMIQEFLLQWGHGLRAVMTAKEAMHRLRDEPPPDLLLLDRALPGMDGLSLCRWVRAHLSPRPPRLVILSEPGLASLPAMARDAGADALIVKPLDAARLREQLAYAEISSRQNLELLRRRFAATRINPRALAC